MTPLLWKVIPESHSFEHSVHSDHSGSSSHGRSQAKTLHSSASEKSPQGASKTNTKVRLALVAFACVGLVVGFATTSDQPKIRGSLSLEVEAQSGKNSLPPGGPVGPTDMCEDPRNIPISRGSQTWLNACGGLAGYAAPAGVCYVNCQEYCDTNGELNLDEDGYMIKAEGHPCNEKIPCYNMEKDDKDDWGYCSKAWGTDTKCVKCRDNK